MATNRFTVLIVPGLRDPVDQHWQTLLAAGLPRVRTVPPMGREDLDCAGKVAAIEREAQAIDGPIIIVAHSGGVVMTVHWARQTRRKVLGAELVCLQSARMWRRIRNARRGNRDNQEDGYTAAHKVGQSVQSL